MAIQFARARYLSRASGGNAVRSSAYNARAAIGAERTGEVFHFRHRDAPEHHAMLLPEGAAQKFADAGVLWNAAEAAERRKDAQVAAGRADPRVAAELDRFMVAAKRRLGEEGARTASNAGHGGWGMTLPGVGQEHQTGLRELARSFRQGHHAMEHSAAWEQRLGREAKAAERERTRQEERQARGLSPEPPRDRQRDGRGLGR